MKNRNNLKWIGLMTAVMLLIFTGCHKDKTAPATGTIMIHLHTDIDTNEAVYGDTFPDANGRKMSLSVAQFYFSNIGFLGSNGTWTTLTGVYALKRVENEEYIVGSIPVGNYTDVRFDVGIDATANATTPSSHASSTASDSVLANTDMWFGTTAHGYTFLNLQGMVDASANHLGGVANTPFSYKIGSAALLKTVTLPAQDFAVTANQQQMVHLICDYGMLLQDIDMTVPANRTTDTYTTNPSTATTIANNIANLFHYEM